MDKAAEDERNRELEADIEGGHETIVKKVKKVFLIPETRHRLINKICLLICQVMENSYNCNFFVQGVSEERISNASSGSLNGSSVEVPAVIIVDDSEREEEAEDQKM